MVSDALVLRRFCSASIVDCRRDRACVGRRECGFTTGMGVLVVRHSLSSGSRFQGSPIGCTYTPASLRNGLEARNNEDVVLVCACRWNGRDHPAHRMACTSPLLMSRRNAAAM